MNNKLKKLMLSLFAICVSQSALSTSYSCSPFYFGAQIGGCNLHYDHSDLAVTATSVDDKGWAGRLLAGIDINQNIGLEAGYTAYQNPEFKYFNALKTDFSQQSLDLLAKLSLPVSCNVSIYAKGGMAYVRRGDAGYSYDNVTVRVSDDTDYIRPMLGVGITYDFSSRVSGDLGYLRTFGTDNLEDADFYGAGITFRVG